MATDVVLSTELPTPRKRARNACDACRARKCDYADGAPPCRPCLALQINCTQDRPRKRRGPPSRYVEALKKPDLDQRLPVRPLEIPSPAELDQVSSYAARFSLDELAPSFVIRQAIDDWFELVHPAAPLLHRDSFLRQLNNPSDSGDPDFLLLVVSVCAATVSTLRRRRAPYAGFITVEKCYHIISTTTQARGPLPISLIRCQTKYNMASALSQERGMDNETTQLLLIEVTAMVGYLLHYDVDTASMTDRELAKRLYWLCFAGQCTLALHGRPSLMPATAFTEGNPLKPREITDAELGPVSPGEELWHGNTTSYIPGLNALSNLFMLWYKSQQCDCSDLAHLRKHMDLVLAALDHVPPPLRWRGGLSRPPRSNFGTDVQMVNLYITQIHIRSYLLDQMYRTAGKKNDAGTVAEVMTARQHLVDDMLAIVYQMPEDALEANGNSLISKLRDIGIALLNENTNPETAFTNLDRLLFKLDRLDVHPGSQGDSTSPVISMTSSHGHQYASPSTPRI